MIYFASNNLYQMLVNGIIFYKPKILFLESALQLYGRLYTFTIYQENKSSSF